MSPLVPLQNLALMWFMALCSLRLALLCSEDLAFALLRFLARCTARRKSRHLLRSPTISGVYP